MVCSDHFESNCFEQKTKNRWLKKGSIPTLFLKDVKIKQTAEELVHLDHAYKLPPAKELKRRLDKATDEIIEKKKKIKRLQTAHKVEKIKCNSLAEVIEETKKKNLLSENVYQKLHDLGSKVPAELFKRLTSQQNQDLTSHSKYPEELKRFALTLQFYSTKGYNYVRKSFLCNLPHENTIRRWYSSVQSETGKCSRKF